MDGLDPEQKYNGPVQKLMPAKIWMSWMSIRPLELGLQNKFKPLLVVTFIPCFSLAYIKCLYDSKVTFTLNNQFRLCMYFDLLCHCIIVSGIDCLLCVL